MSTTITALRPDVITESMLAITLLRFEIRVMKAALNIENLHQTCIDYANEQLAELTECLKQRKETLSAQLEAIKYELLQIDKEIEVLGSDVFERQAERQQLTNLLFETETFLKDE